MKKIKVIAVSDSFKSAASSAEIGESIKKGFISRSDAFDVTVLPVGDGGEGTANALMCALQAEKRYVKVSDTHREKVVLEYGIFRKNGKTVGFFDMASAAGIAYSKKHSSKIMSATTYGVGEAIKHLISENCNEILIGLGGSGTNDGGIGALSALGAAFFDKDLRPIDAGMGASILSDVRVCDLSKALNLLLNVRLTLLYDVSVPLIGENGASRMFSRQKGASVSEVDILEKSMKNFASVMDRYAGKCLSAEQGTGAAGGLGYALRLIGGELVSGASYVLELLDFRHIAREADIVITGEGKTDIQTAAGKLPSIVAEYSQPTPVICLCGFSQPTRDLYEKGITAVFSIADAPMTFSDSVSRTLELVEKESYNVAGLVLSLLYSKMNLDK